ncbi:unnamed protein product [Blepharisma stoltei]|uniref:Uncharacterized protein n=1 Tax=Blepharisma stoltei TaxID=1481888 RepID=A0AAU9KBR6_9CILI|nr:unnamed protein product [Blepharisma stoltei]
MKGWKFGRKKSVVSCWAKDTYWEEAQCDVLLAWIGGVLGLLIARNLCFDCVMLTFRMYFFIGFNSKLGYFNKWIKICWWFLCLL